MPSTTDIQLICFDLGRVLVQLCDGWEHACELAGVPCSARFVEQLAQPAVREVMIQSEIGRISPRDFDTRIADLLEVEASDVEAACRAWLREPYPGFDDLLDRLDQTRVRTACLSNTNARHWDMMTGRVPSNAVLPLQRLHYHFTSFTIGAMKPDPAIYAHVEQTTALPPAAIVFFDDDPNNVAAAQSRGWHAVHLPPTVTDPVAAMTRELVRVGVIGG